MTLRLVVKGDMFTAARAAAARGVPFTFIRENNGETIGRTGDQHRKAVEAWFAEPPRDAPFPAGALLHFLWEGLAHMESA
jgi:hypothetical protein